MKKISKDHRMLKATINELPEDIRAEVVVADIINNGNYHEESITVKNNGGHKRGFSTDIDRVKTRSYFARKIGFEFRLNRDGIYDLLPESFFHNSAKQEYGRDYVKQVIEDLQKQKQEEIEARKFFAPLENEFFYHRSVIEKNEVEYLFKISKYDLQLPIFDLSQVDIRLPNEMCKKWICLLPYIRDIVGNIEVLPKCLSYLLNEKVSLEILNPKKDFIGDSLATLGNSLLGDTTIIGNDVNAYFDRYVLIIKDISATKAARFIQGYEYYNFMQTFNETFIPMQLDLEWKFEVKNDSLWEVNINKHTSRLGYTTNI